jgi:hypothetical protein
MALRTGNVFMTAVKLKSGLVMIEPDGFPSFKIMTPGTGIIIAGIKLLIVDIFMTGQATFGKTRKLLLYHPVFIGFEMALFTIGIGMFSGQPEVGGVVLKPDHAPGSH